MFRELFQKNDRKIVFAKVLLIAAFFVFPKSIKAQTDPQPTVSPPPDATAAPTSTPIPMTTLPPTPVPTPTPIPMTTTQPTASPAPTFIPTPVPTASPPPVISPLPTPSPVSTADQTTNSNGSNSNNSNANNNHSQSAAIVQPVSDPSPTPTPQAKPGNAIQALTEPASQATTAIAQGITANINPLIERSGIKNFYSDGRPSLKFNLIGFSGSLFLIIVGVMMVTYDTIVQKVWRPYEEVLSNPNAGNSFRIIE